MNKNTLLVGLSLVFSMGLIEGFLIWKPEFQALVPFSEFVVCAGSAEPLRTHQIFGWTAVPNSTYFERRSEADDWVVHIYNTQGFRDLFDSGKRHVVVLGDSYTQGSDVSNHESFPYLLDLWNDDMAFHNFGTGGYGTANSLSVYKFFSSIIPHDLVVLAYFMGNDLHDNLNSLQPDDDDDVIDDAGAISWYDTLKEANSRIRQIFRSYNLVYSAIRPVFGRSELPIDKIEVGVENTERLLKSLIEQVRNHNVDLLLVALPSWNQMEGYGGITETGLQRSLLRKLDENFSHVHLIDMSDTVAREGTDAIYGMKDKHFSRYGYYVTAKAIHEWINFKWRGAPQPGKHALPFRPPDAPVSPDCAEIPEYRAKHGMLDHG